MRILNRPMFRYGGPIREGVMHGMRSGGRAALVGNPVYPKTGGREHHSVWKTIFGAGAKPVVGGASKPGFIRTQAPKAWKKIKNIFGSTTIDKTKGIPKNLQGVFTQTGTTPGITSTGAGRTFLQNLKSFPGATKALGWAKKAKDVALKYPKSTAVGGVYVAPKIIANVPTPKWSGSWGIKDILVPDEIYNYETGRWFNPDDTDLKPSDKKILEEKKIEAIGEGAQFKESTAPELTASQRTKLAKDQQNARLKSYLDMMGYDSAKKGALSDA
jgi:hypothetical protein